MQGIIPREARWRFAVGAAAIVAGLAGVWPLVAHPADLLVGSHREINDLTHQFLARQTAPRACLSRFGQWPAWSPWLAWGNPIIGNPQSAAFYPPNWLLWLVGPRVLISWSLAAHLVWAGVGAALLCRRLGGKGLGAAVAGATLAGSPILLAHAAEGHLVNIQVFAWYPWTLWAYERARAGARFGTAGLAVVLAAAILAGHIQEVAYLLLALGLLWACDLGVRLRAGWRSAAGTGALARSVPLGLAAALGLAMVEIVPLAVYIRHSAHSARLSGAEGDHAGPANLLQLLHPMALGGPSRYRGPGDYYWETLCHFGLAAECLAVVGLAAALWPRGDNRGAGAAARLALVGGLGLALALKGHTPIYGWLEAVTPGLRLMRYPSRALFLSATAAAALAGLGADAVASVAGQRRLRLGVGLASGLVAATALLMMAAAFGWMGDPRHWTAVGDARSLAVAGEEVRGRLAPALVLGAVATLLALAAAKPGRAPRAAAWFVPLIACEAAWFGGQVFRTIPPRAGEGPGPVVTALASRPEGMVLAQQVALGDEEAIVHGLRKVAMYDTVPLARTVELLEAFRFDPANGLIPLLGFAPVDLSRVPKDGLDLLGIRYAVLLADDAVPVRRLGLRPLGAGPLRLPHEPARGRVRSAPEFELWENPGAFPRGFVVGRARVAGPGETPRAALAVLRPREEVLLDRDVLPPGPRQAFRAARLVEDTPSRVALEVETEQPGYLVRADAWYPGWAATVDGRATPVLPADHAFQAVALPSSGRHRVVFTYAPAGFGAALVASLATMAGLGFAARREMAPGRANLA